MQDRNAPPLNPLPPVVWLLALPMIVLEVAFSLGAAGVVGGPQAIGWRNAAIEQFGVWPDYWREQYALGALDFELLARFIAYPFLHISLSQALFAIVIVLALGKFVGEIFRWWAVLVVFFASAIAGGLVYASIPAIRPPLFGAYPGDYGLIGAFTFLLWVKLAGTGTSQFRAFSMIGFLMVVQLLFGLLFGGGYEWVADFVGFATGFVLSSVVSPGGWRHMVERIRQR
ncbi:MAG: rhomboid family intramembrane serine protease [Rhodobacterales bacterium RIFCSPHIGHO2_02_FULL_62_130]|nr:MAG: rhomboid family intramembrane serine protease [Rhodobacterales bacterium RIFCSPHIGHO2_02_FULL_62_130]OHC60987.1 MAG: rhomboid family intramembrane serine protease [Rhodobacterales bacterium RIFCSPHIGHO2_12_FULL_62_75]HCY99176.1 rhomboid family intramembrane serine protease [Rhodobacter sp.]